ncbi:hypothetical protein QE152_g5221 [Popillia japonica]|uniref:Uncharacterized protein n=1 Tax=Popillia japonica TaxID=7064 RepID=A0AAW1MID3_POPJA
MEMDKKTKFYEVFYNRKNNLGKNCRSLSLDKYKSLIEEWSDGAMFGTKARVGLKDSNLPPESYENIETEEELEKIIQFETHLENDETRGQIEESENCSENQYIKVLSNIIINQGTSTENTQRDDENVSSFLHSTDSTTYNTVLNNPENLNENNNILNLSENKQDIVLSTLSHPKTEIENNRLDSVINENNLENSYEDKQDHNQDIALTVVTDSVIDSMVNAYDKNVLFDISNEHNLSKRLICNLCEKVGDDFILCRSCENHIHLECTRNQENDNVLCNLCIKSNRMYAKSRK